MTLINQNYFVNEGKTSSRVSQAPGGRSSVNLGWGELGEDEGSKCSNNTFANGNNMNSGNVLTDRPSSRVINPPGGRSSICLAENDLTDRSTSPVITPPGENLSVCLNEIELADRKCFRVLNPPGGKSSIRFG